MTTKIYSFRTNEEPNLSKVGGKGKALIETSKAGFPVPKGFVLSVDFFEPWIQKIKALDEWKTVIRDTKKEQCNIIKEKALLFEFTNEQKLIFDEALEEFAQSGIFAVRSSSPEEDLEGTSFAGMYETNLGVVRSRLHKAVAIAFSSAFDFRVMEYKLKNNIDLEKTSIAVVVQRQIASDLSGVGFSVNPSNNCYDEVMINASLGLGESIVSGMVTPDTYVVDTVTNKIIEKNIGKKETALWLGENGGVLKREVSDPEVQALDDEQIIELTKLIKKCEEYYDRPMDIEWAFESGKLYLLQSRPITAYLPLFPELVTKKGDRKKLYIDLIVMSQGFSDSLSVLGTELWAIMLYEIKNNVFTTDIDGLAPTLHGRQYINVSEMLKVWGLNTSLKFVSTYDENINKIFTDIDLIGEYKAEIRSQSTKCAKFKMISMVLKMLPSVIKVKFSNYEEVVNDYNNIADKIISTMKDLKLDRNFDEIFNSTMKDLVTIMNKAGIMMAGMSAFSSIKKMFKGMDMDHLIIALGMDLDGNPTSEMGHMLFDIANSNDFKLTKSLNEFLINIKNRGYSDDFMNLYDDYILKFGARGFKEIDVASKRVYEDPSILYEKLVNINTENSQIIRLKEKKKKVYDELLEASKKEGFDKKFIKQAQIYQATFGYREHPKYIIVMIYGKIHDLALLLGEKFVEEGRLDDKYHIFDLNLSQITEAQNSLDVDLRAYRDLNLRPYKKVEHVKNWPLVINSRGKIFNPKIDLNEGDLVGSPIASGIARGRAKILKSPYEKAVNPGEILITRATEPSWTPIFINAAGIVMEIGGPLQHGGIIAREYGIPCVSGLIGIMDIIKDGDLIEVDGNNGVVRIIES